MDQSRSELQDKTLQLFLIPDLQTYGSHPKNVGYHWLVGYTTIMTNPNLKLM